MELREQQDAMLVCLYEISVKYMKLRQVPSCILIVLMAVKASAQDAASPVGELKAYLRTPHSERQPPEKLDFAEMPLTAPQVIVARRLLAEDFVKRIRAERQEEVESGVVQIGPHRMPFFTKTFGEKPADGRSLYISLHGGGGAPATVNDRQWENQKRLYEPQEGVYLAPRAPTNTWNLWHQKHIDALLLRLIQNMAAFEDVNWNRVYIMGYSAGGDGVYQLAPRMSDHWAAAAMMAGHPNETSATGLRNLPFCLQVGGRDAAYDRNKIAGEWESKLKELHRKDPAGYIHMVKIYPRLGHWMNRQDRIALSWMAKYTRNPVPKKIVWKQDDVTHPQLYWLGVADAKQKAGSEIVAEVAGQTINMSSPDVDRVMVFPDDRFIDLNQPITMVFNGEVRYQGLVSRTIASLINTLSQSGDPTLTFPAVIAD